MATKREAHWQENYLALKAYIEQYRHLPDKKKVENRGLLNWWKYQKRCMKQGRLTEEKVEMLLQLGAMREMNHGGGLKHDGASDE